MHMQRTPLLMHRLLDRGATIAPDEEIVTLSEDGCRRQTYRQTRDRAHQLAHALRDAGIAVGDSVGTFMWNGSRHLEAYHAIAGMGAILHTINIRLAPGDLEYIINHAEDRLIIVDADLLPLLEPLRERMPCVERIVVAAEPGFENWQTELPDAIDYEEFIAAQPAHYEWPEIDENSPLGLCYTSGTTGQPKGVLYEHRSQYLHTITMCMTDVMNLSATDVVCGIVPMFHAMGWGLPWSATMLGSKQVMPHRFMQADRLVRLIADEQVTVSAGVPTIWQNVKAAIQTQPDRYDLSQLSRVTCGGSAPPKSLLRWYWNELGVEMIQGWGMTETSPIVTIARKVAKRSQRQLSVDQQFDNIAKAGLCLPGVEMEIFDEQFNRLPHDGKKVGEVLVRGPWICAQYYKDSQPEKFHQDWLITGDVAKIDAEEYLIITDRSKDLIKTGGEWISSVDLENHIVGLAGVGQACVVAQPHPKWDERPVALVILQSGVNLDEKKVRADLQQQGYQLPDLR